MGTVESKSSDSTDIDLYDESEQNGFINYLRENCGYLGDENFYNLFDLPEGIEISPEVKSMIERKFRELSYKYHPDKNLSASSEEKDFNDGMMIKITLAKETLLNPEHKKTYDNELLGGRHSTWRWVARWGFSIICALGCVSVTVLSHAAAPVTGGGSLALGLCLIAPALRKMSWRTAKLQFKDPNCSSKAWRHSAKGALAEGLFDGAFHATTKALLGDDEYEEDAEEEEEEHDEGDNAEENEDFVKGITNPPNVYDDFSDTDSEKIDDESSEGYSDVDENDENSENDDESDGEKDEDLDSCQDYYSSSEENDSEKLEEDAIKDYQHDSDSSN